MIYINLSEIMEIEGFNEEEDKVEIVFNNENFEFKTFKDYGDKSSIVLRKICGEELNNCCEDIEIVVQEDKNNTLKLEEHEVLDKSTNIGFNLDNKEIESYEKDEYIEEVNEVVEEHLKILDADYNILTKTFSLNLNRNLDSKLIKNNFFDIFEINLMEEDNKYLKFVNKVEKVDIEGNLVKIKFESFQSLDLSKAINIKFIENNIIENVDLEKIDVNIVKYFIKNEKEKVKLFSGQELNKILTEFHFSGIVEEFEMTMEGAGYLFTNSNIKVKKINNDMYAINDEQNIKFKDSEEKYVGYVGFKEANISLKLPTGIKKVFNLSFKFLDDKIVAIWDYNDLMNEIVETMKLENIAVSARG
ncbi:MULTISPECIES: hypothetical protein [Clostridium]|uniref:Uncharacterized protein n=1 Tax=Clostridium senegalense TaxID=1465809 RepID=A0A6M0H494_9CLOT|nr:MULTISPECIES: hypothetical protein [Clostridium]NEU05566.1 hypothetical protein [Clostridium senegalense]